MFEYAVNPKAFDQLAQDMMIALVARVGRVQALDNDFVTYDLVTSDLITIHHIAVDVLILPNKVTATTVNIMPNIGAIRIHFVTSVGIILRVVHGYAPK